MRKTTLIGAALAVALASTGARAEGPFHHSAPPAVDPAETRAEADAKAGKPEPSRANRSSGREGPQQAKRTKVELVAREKKNAVAIAGAPKGTKYHAIVSKYASTYGVPVSLAHAVIRIESNYRPDVRGRAGEVGLMQIKPSTARGLGYTGSVKALYNPETNIRWGMKYLGMAQRLGGGSTCGTILKYNAGHGAKRMNPVSAAYCAKVKRHMGG